MAELLRLEHDIITVKAGWDDDAAVWVASSCDIPGLEAEAPTLKALHGKILAMIAALAALNG